MGSSDNALRWDGAPGHYEVYYLSLTDPRSGVGLWIRYTMLAPAQPSEEATCALWVMAMDPRVDGGELLARKATLPISALAATAQPFTLRIGEALLDDHGMRGGVEDASWDLRWEPRLPPYHHVHPALRAARVARTVLTLPHADLAVAGTVSLAGRELVLDGARGGQAHLWGSKHAGRWAWAPCTDLCTPQCGPIRDMFIDAVSVFVPHLGREVGPSTPVVGRFLGSDFS